MRAWSLAVSALALPVIFCAASFLRSQTTTATTSRYTVTLPVTEVVLYANGLGQFHRAGEVEGQSQVELSASYAEMNDLLKWMKKSFEKIDEGLPLSDRIKIKPDVDFNWKKLKFESVGFTLEWSF